MVYCRLQSVDGNKAIYAIGSVISDITGKIKIDFENKEYSILEQSKKYKVYEHFIDKMLLKYKTQLEKGIIPDKMSYEI